MKALRSLHAKILFGYCVVGGLFIVLVANALVQFRGLEDELARQQQVVSFYDAVRHARRLEKNFLLYLKMSDLNEALARINDALDALEEIRGGSRWVTVGDPEAESVVRYRNLLLELQDSSRDGETPQALLDKLYAAGAAVLKFGEKLDAAARGKVAEVVARHDADLRYTIWAALALALLTGILVTRSVVRPLRVIEADLHRVAKGEVGRLDRREAGDEVESLTRSINETIQEIEMRHHSLARSSRLMALGTMLSGVAHELNNPLSNISSSCQILQEEWSELPEQESRRLLEQIDGQAVRAQRIVSALLDFSGGRAMQRGRENVRSLVEESLYLVGNEIGGPLTATVDVPHDIGIDVDRMRFQQVLVNMIKNAAEAVAADGTLSIRAWREDFPEGRGTTMEIEDDGAGIPPESLNRIFDPFFTTKPVGKGTGLGLSVAHEIVTQHGGVLSVDSRPGAGTRFWIHIPDSNDKATDNG